MRNKRIKCQNCGEKIKDKKFISCRFVCNHCFYELKEKNKQKEKGVKRCKSPFCNRLIRAENKSGYCYHHYHSLYQEKYKRRKIENET